MNQAEEDALGAIAEVHSDTLRWLISDDDPRRPIAHALLYTEEAIRAAVAQERERAAKGEATRDELLRMAVAAKENDKRTEAEIIEDGLAFVMDTRVGGP